MDIYISITPKFFIRRPVEVIREFQKCDVNKVIKGFELYFDLGIKEHVAFAKDFASLCSKEGYELQFHNDCVYDLERQKAYLEFVSAFSRMFDGKLMPVVFHTVYGDDILENVRRTSEFMSDLLEYVYQKDLKVILSVENLDDKTWTVRLDKSEMREIIYNNENLYFTYDIGNEIIEYGNITDVDYLLERRMINIHLHTFDKYDKHVPIYENDEHKLRWLKALTYLKLINYRGPICLEYEYNIIPGKTFEEKIRNTVISAEFVDLHLEHDEY